MPATRERIVRPGSSFSSRQSVTSGVSGPDRPRPCAFPERPPTAVREKKGVVMPRRQSARKRLAIDLSVEGL